jgi:anti-sigma factor RsiW
MTDARRWLTVEPPPWAEAHLALDAIVAYTDDELAPGPRSRAFDHLSHCPDCSAEVMAQHQARSALRSALAPSLPSSLLTALRAIPQDADLPEPPAGLSVSADGQLVSMLRVPVPTADRPDRRGATPRWVRLGAGAVVSGVALGALMIVAPATHVAGPAGGGQPAAPRAAIDADTRLGGSGGSNAAAGVLDDRNAAARVAPSVSMFSRLR